MELKCSVCGSSLEDRGYKHTQCHICGQVSNLCCDPELDCGWEAPDNPPEFPHVPAE